MVKHEGYNDQREVQAGGGEYGRCHGDAGGEGLLGAGKEKGDPVLPFESGQFAAYAAGRHDQEEKNQGGYKGQTDFFHAEVMPGVVLDRIAECREDDKEDEPHADVGHDLLSAIGPLPHPLPDCLADQKRE